MQITDVKVWNFRQPMAALHRKRFAGDLEISLVAIETDDGITGYSSARAQGGTSGQVLTEHIIKSAKPRLIGENPLDREMLWKRLFDLEQGMYMPIFVTSAVDVALWDIAGKVMNQPVYRVIGGARDRILGYASSAYHETVDQYLEDAKAAFEAGFLAYKLHPFRDADKDIALCRAMREKYGNSVILMLDAGGAYTRQDALRVGRCLEELRFEWFEEPLSHYDLDGNRDLRSRLDIPIVGAETIAGSAFTAVSAALHGAFDMVLCDVYWKMGITGMLKVIRACEAINVRIASHHGASPIMNTANLHCLCATTSADYMEILVPEEGYNFGLDEYATIDSSGYVSVPNSPGLGIEVDWDYIHANLASAV